MTEPHPVRLVVTDDLRRSRLTVFFRAFIAIPHYLWAAILGTAVFFGVFANWFILLVKGKTPEGLHNFIAGYIRYLMHLEAYFLLAANPFPGFYPFDEKPYPVDLKIDPPAPQNRWKTFFRLFLAIPAILISSTLFIGGARTGGYLSGGLAFLIAFFCWFVALYRGRAAARDARLASLLPGLQRAADRVPLSSHRQVPVHRPGGLRGRRNDERRAPHRRSSGCSRHGATSASSQC